MLFNDITVLSKYLTGSPRRPFRSPRKFFILAVTNVTPGWQETGSWLLEKLWKCYGIANAILAFPYANDVEKV